MYWTVATLRATAFFNRTNSNRCYLLLKTFMEYDCLKLHYCVAFSLCSTIDANNTYNFCCTLANFDWASKFHSLNFVRKRNESKGLGFLWTFTEMNSENCVEHIPCCSNVGIICLGKNSCSAMAKYSFIFAILLFSGGCGKNGEENQLGWQWFDTGDLNLFHCLLCPLNFAKSFDL